MSKAAKSEHPEPEEILDELLAVVRKDVVGLTRKRKLAAADRRALSDYVRGLVQAAAHRRRASEDDRKLDEMTPDEMDRMAEDLKRRAEDKRAATT